MSLVTVVVVIHTKYFLSCLFPVAVRAGVWYSRAGFDVLFIVERAFSHCDAHILPSKSSFLCSDVLHLAFVRFGKFQLSYLSNEMLFDL